MNPPNDRQNHETIPRPPTPRLVEVVNPRYAGATPEDVARALLRPVGARRPKTHPAP